MGVEVAGEGLDGGAPLVGLVALVEGDRLRDQDVDADEQVGARARKTPSSSTRCSSGERAWISAGTAAMVPIGWRSRGAGAGLPPGEGEQLAAERAASSSGGRRGGPVQDQGERRAREEAHVLEREDRQQAGAVDAPGRVVHGAHVTAGRLRSVAPTCRRRTSASVARPRPGRSST